MPTLPAICWILARQSSGQKDAAVVASSLRGKALTKKIEARPFYFNGRPTAHSQYQMNRRCGTWPKRTPQGGRHTNPLKLLDETGWTSTSFEQIIPISQNRRGRRFRKYCNSMPSLVGDTNLPTFPSSCLGQTSTFSVCSLPLLSK